MAAPTATSYKIAELVPLFTRMLELCELKDSESLVILSDPDTNQEYTAAMCRAARSFGADVLT